MKKYILLLLLNFFLLACGNNTENKNNTEKVKITIIGENTANIQSIMSIEKEYEKLNPNIDLIFHPHSFDEAQLKSTQDFANGTGQYDIVMQYNFALSSFVRNNYVYELDELLKNIPTDSLTFQKDLFEKTWQSVGHYYKDVNNHNFGIKKVGFPFAANTMLLVYNKTLFESEENKKEYKKIYKKELTAPTTWEDFYEIAKFFTNKDKKTYGVCLEGASGGSLFYDWINVLFSMDGKILEKERGWESEIDTKVVVKSPNFLKSLQYFKSLKPFNAGNFSNVESIAEMDYMKQGNVAMTISWDDVIVSKMITDTTFKDLKKFGFAPIPGTKSVIGGGSFFINRLSKEPRETSRFIVWLLQPQTQIKLAKAGLSSPLKSVYNDVEISKLPHIKALSQSLERGGIYPEAGPDATMISEKMTTYIQKYWNDEITAEEAAQKMQTEIEAERKKIFEALKQ